MKLNLKETLLKGIIFGAGAAIGLGATAIIAVAVSSMTTFNPGDQVKSGQINANFNNLRSAVENLANWTNGDSGTDATFMNGRVGIGTSNPVSELDVTADQNVAGIEVTTYRNSSFLPGSFTGKGARGTAASPSAVLTNDYLAIFNANGYGSTGFSSYPSQGRIAFRAAEDWTDSAQGTYLTFFTTSSGANSPTNRMLIADNGNVGIGTATPNSKLAVTGLPSGITDAVASGTLAGAVCITDTGDMYIDTEGSCAN
jgi:hypothetical protein